MAREATRQELASWLHDFRWHMNMTQKQLAETLGVHRTTINRWEKMVLYPDRDRRMQLNELSQEAGFTPVPIKKF